VHTTNHDDGISTRLVDVGLEMAFVLPHKTSERCIPSAGVSPVSERGGNTLRISGPADQLFPSFPICLHSVYGMRNV
jgi:hypothetical protein